MSSDDHQLPPNGTDEPPPAAELARIDALLAAPATWVEPDAGLEARALAAVRRRATAGTPTPATAPVTPIDGPGTSVRRSARVWRARVTGGLVGIAAASLLFVGIAVARRPPAPKLSLRLTATALAPGAGGTAKLSETNSGWEIKLDTTGLTRLDNGRFYEAWLEGPKGVVSIGTFHTGAKITLWAGVEADEYTTLAVTIETEDGNPAQSNERVLTAALTP